MRINCAHAVCVKKNQTIDKSHIDFITGINKGRNYIEGTALQA